MGRADRITILLSVAALCVTIVGTSCSTNARIGDLHARIDDLGAGLNARIDDLGASLNARIDDLGVSLNGRIDDLAESVHARIDALQEETRDLRALMVETIKAATPAAD